MPRVAAFLGRFAICLALLPAGCGERPAARSPARLPRAAQSIGRPAPVPSRELVREGDEFRHRTAEVRVRLPAEWRPSEGPTDVSAISTLKLERPDGLQATLTFAPLERELALVALDQARVLRAADLYGRERVSDPYQVEVAGKQGWRIDVAPEPDGGERGVMWLFEANPPQAAAWRVRLRATLPANAPAEELEPLIAALALP